MYYYIPLTLSGKSADERKDNGRSVSRTSLEFPRNSGNWEHSVRTVSDPRPRVSQYRPTTKEIPRSLRFPTSKGKSDQRISKIKTNFPNQPKRTSTSSGYYVDGGTSRKVYIVGPNLGGAKTIQGDGYRPSPNSSTIRISSGIRVLNHPLACPCIGLARSRCGCGHQGEAPRATNKCLSVITPPSGYDMEQPLTVTSTRSARFPPGGPRGTSGSGARADTHGEAEEWKGRGIKLPARRRTSKEDQQGKKVPFPSDPRNNCGVVFQLRTSPLGYSH
ncbi:hypothetical protein EGW08_001640 [Elysia chlorotica]|uniref:Uncharacterized protein n=1 Tax=Elysia chlorotica TaxID=188477 RepID=A0A3S0ZZL3_ELYCH|nr:hypothetical protein EGW08_001640 [Elysia chlorotica]